MSHRNSVRDDLANAGRGLLMGGADIVPGVSGGTVALVLGIYERLVTALSHVDARLLGLLRRREWAAAAAHLDLRFLIALGCGVVVGIGGLAGVMHHLLTHHPVPTWSLMFGLIAASSLLVAGMVERWGLSSAMALIAGTAFAYWLVGVVPASGREGPGYLFLCGMVAICAMILPGISGAFILLILGMYLRVTGMLKEVIGGHWTPQNLTAIIVFASGCLCGLLLFSKFLRWLLARHESVTMATLCGFMLGSLRKIWPFKEDVTDVAYLERLGLPADKIAAFTSDPTSLNAKFRLVRNTLPSSWDGEVLLALGLAVAGAAAVLLLDRVTRGHRQVPPLEAADHEPRQDG